MWVRQEVDSGNNVMRASGNSSEFSESIWHFDTPNSGIAVDAAIGRGVATGANTLQTYLRLCRPDGSSAYITVATGATAITVSNTAP